MSLNTKRIIAKLDIKGPNLIKGIELDGLRVLGKAWDFAKKYYHEGIDELIYQDAVASLYDRNSLKDIIKQTAREVFIPVTVAGGIRTIADIQEVLKSGADKVAINTAAIENPEFIKKAASIFGSQCIVCSIEAFKSKNGTYESWVNYGRERTGVDVFQWAQRVVELGAGEIFLTSINQDGTGRGYDLDLIKKINDSVDVPVVASGGAGQNEDVEKLFKQTDVSAAAIGSIFHYYYADSLNSEASYRQASSQLRMGDHIDTGNMDYIFYGYGGSRDLFVQPSDVKSLKQDLRKKGVGVRL